MSEIERKYSSALFIKILQTRNTTDKFSEAIAYPRSSGAPPLKPFPENVLALRQAGHRRCRLYFAHETVHSIQSHLTPHRPSSYFEKFTKFPNC